MPIRHTWPSSGTVRTVCRVGGKGGWAGILMGLLGAPLMRGVRELRRRSWTGRVVGKCIFGGGEGCEGMVVGGGRDEGETGGRRFCVKERRSVVWVIWKLPHDVGSLA